MIDIRTSGYSVNAAGKDGLFSQGGFALLVGVIALLFLAENRTNVPEATEIPDALMLM